ncbi:MAG TPA: hypothetical protein DCY13_09475 [Verrucomicrobiales bacterium]|nr:hypothetical protein [Verrucomicrobiales bacterium]
MKTSSCLVIVAVSFCLLQSAASAQVSYGAEAYAARQQEEERWRKLNAQVEEVAGTAEVLRRRVQALEEENRTLRSELSRKSENAVSPEEFQRVMKEMADKLKELDSKRISDNKTLMAEVEKLIRNLKPAGGSAPSSPVVVQPPPSQEGYTHIIQPGETISAVVAAFRAQGVRVSVDEVLKANPGLDPRRMSVGQEIFIPKPR